jgi:hypothetical protein
VPVEGVGTAITGAVVVGITSVGAGMLLEPVAPFVLAEMPVAGVAVEPDELPVPREGPVVAPGVALPGGQTTPGLVSGS